MGQEIDRKKFTANDFDIFTKNVKYETEQLRQWFKTDQLSHSEKVAGLELEAWLIDQQFRPAPVNEAFFDVIESEYFTPELARFNIELNVDPVLLKDDVLTKLESSVRHHWQQSKVAAQSLGADVLATGILPTLVDADLTVDNMSKMARYEALNEQVLNKRKGKPLHLHIVGKNNMQATHYDVMLEAAATSIQIHLQVPVEQAVAYYNSAIFISALTVAVSANSPFLFGESLWEESRIPLFEQAVASGGFDAVANGPLHRVSFGSGYCRDSLMECFDENLEHFPGLLPMHFEDGAKELNHLRLHNGTIWRWNRPIIGFVDEQPHLRIEHRVMPSGPTITDQMANTALFYGLVQYYANNEVISEQRTEFAMAKDNFYQAARHGLAAHVKWLDGKSYTIKQLLLDELLEKMKQGLQQLNIQQDDIDRYYNVLYSRVDSSQTGSSWQQAFVKQHGKDMTQLTRQYAINQTVGNPVHEWDFEIT